MYRYRSLTLHACRLTHNDAKRLLCRFNQECQDTLSTMWSRQLRHSLSTRKAGLGKLVSRVVVLVLVLDCYYTTVLRRDAKRISPIDSGSNFGCEDSPVTPI